MQSATVEDVVEEYSRIQSSGHHHALLGLDDGVPAFLMEEYLPSPSPLAGVYAVQPGDIGMHLLVGPPAGPPRTGLHRRRRWKPSWTGSSPRTRWSAWWSSPTPGTTKSMCSTSGWASSLPAR